MNKVPSRELLQINDRFWEWVDKENGRDSCPKCVRGVVEGDSNDEALINKEELEQINAWIKTHQCSDIGFRRAPEPFEIEEVKEEDNASADENVTEIDSEAAPEKDHSFCRKPGNELLPGYWGQNDKEKK